jgi:hypothetical protein
MPKLALKSRPASAQLRSAFLIISCHCDRRATLRRLRERMIPTGVPSVLEMIFVSPDGTKTPDRSSDCLPWLGLRFG